MTYPRTNSYPASRGRAIMRQVFDGRHTDSTVPRPQRVDAPHNPYESCFARSRTIGEHCHRLPSRQAGPISAA